MAFCPNCGTQVAGRFCPNCGTDVGSAQAAGTAGPAGPAGTAGPAGSAYVPPSSGSTYVPPAAPISAPGLQENVASALCYLFGFITGIIFLVLAPYNKNRTIRFHAFQSIFASIALWIIEFVIFAMVFPMLHFWSTWSLLRLYQLAVFLGWIYMMYTAYNNRKVVLPVVGPLAEKQA